MQGTGNQKATIEKQYPGVSKADDLKEVLCNTLIRLGYRVNAPKNSKRITGTLHDEFKGMTRFQLLYEVQARYDVDSAGGKLNLTVSESKQKFGAVYCKQKLKAICDALDEELQDFQEIRETAEPPTTYGSAKFATEESLQATGFLSESRNPQRLLLAPWSGGRNVSVPQALTAHHALVCGPTGAGKSSGFFIPNICERTTSSCIVTEATAGDEAPELYAKTAGWRHSQGNEIYYFNPDHLDSTRINPLDKVIFAPLEQQASAAESIADLVIMNTSPPTSQRGDPIWDKSEKWLLWIMIMHAVSSGNADMMHFGAIRSMLRKHERAITGELRTCKRREVALEFQAFMNHTSENFRHGVFAGLLSRLNPWLTDRIVTLTRVSDVDINVLQKQLFTFYLSVPSRKRQMKPVAALMFNYLLDLALEQHFQNPLALVLDEFTNFGAIPGIHEALSIIRRRDLPVVLGIQSYAQVELLYGDNIAKQIVQQLATRIYFRPRDRDTAWSLSQELGNQTMVRKDITATGQTIEREFGLPLMSVSDLMTMDPADVLIMMPGGLPLKTRRFTHESYPAPVGYDPPERVMHTIERVSVSDEQLKQERAFLEKPAPKPMTGERQFFDRTQLPSDVEPTKKKAVPEQPAITDEIETDWNIPG